MHTTSPIKSSELIRTITQQTNASLTLYTIMIQLWKWNVGENVMQN